MPPCARLALRAVWRVVIFSFIGSLAFGTGNSPGRVAALSTRCSRPSGHGRMLWRGGSKVLHAVINLIPVANAVQQFEQLHQRTDAVFLLRTPSDARVQIA